MALPTVFRYLVLGLLRYGTPRHGYAIMKEYRERSGVQVSTGNFYRELQRLVGEGLVRTAANPPGADPRRAPYEITEAGAIVFDGWLSASNDAVSTDHEDELSSRVLFVADADASVARRVIARWQEELWIKGKVLERSREEALMRSAAAGRGTLSALSLLLARRLKHVAADLEFLDEFRTAYEEWAGGNKGGTQLRTRSGAPLRAARRRSREGKGNEER